MVQNIFLKYQWIILLCVAMSRRQLNRWRSGPAPGFTLRAEYVARMSFRPVDPLQFPVLSHLEMEIISVCDSVHFLLVTPKLQPLTKPHSLFVKLFPGELVSSPFSFVPPLRSTPITFITVSSSNSLVSSTSWKRTSPPPSCPLWNWEPALAQGEQCPTPVLQAQPPQAHSEALPWWGLCFLWPLLPPCYCFTSNLTVEIQPSSRSPALGLGLHPQRPLSPQSLWGEPQQPLPCLVMAAISCVLLGPLHPVALVPQLVMLGM